MDRSLKTKIAFWYYSCGMTQDEIASRLCLTRQKVNSIIGSLKEDGIVSISISGEFDNDISTERIIEDTFGLQRVIIAPSYEDPKLAFLKVANVAAEYLEQSVSNGDTVGVSWGRTLKATISEMRFQNKPNCCVVQLLGAQSMDNLGTKSDDIVRSLSEKLNCGSYLLYAPVVVSKKEIKDLLINEVPIKKSFEAMRNCDVGIFGIGEIKSNAPMHKMGYLTDTDIKELNEAGFIADIGLNPIRYDGSFDNCFLGERLLNADTECIKSIKNTVGIASGAEKAEAVIAVLRSGLLKTLIIDSLLGNKILSLLNNNK